MRTLSLIITAALTISSQAKAWGWREHRTYHRPPVVVHPIHPTYLTYPTYPTYPVYQPAPIYRPAPVYWRNGYWSHSWHENRFGWWWVSGNGWSLHAAPVYPYPAYEPQTTVIYESAPPQPPPPPVTIIQQSAPEITQTAAVEPRPSGNTAPPSSTGMYYFCDASQLYYPYAKTCSERWRAVSSIPAD